MQKINIKDEFLSNFKCDKPKHFNKQIDYICQKKECSDRFICSVCLLKEHQSHFSDIILIEEFFEQFNQSKSKDTNYVENTENLSDEYQIFYDQSQIQMNKSINYITQEITLIQEMIEKTKNEVIKNIENSHKNQKIRYTDKIKELESGLIDNSKDNLQIAINNQNDLQNYIDQYFHKSQQSKFIKIEKLLLQLNQLKSMQIKVDQFPLITINNIFQKMENQQYFQTINDYMQHRYMIRQNTSNLDYMQLKQNRVILTSHNKPIYKLIFLENETKIATASEDATIGIWLTKTGELLKSYSGHTDRIWNLVELQDGRLASGSSDHQIRIWNLKTEQCDAVLVGHTGFVCAIMSYQDNLISGSQDKTIKFWDIKTKQCTKTFKKHQQGKIMSLIMISNTEICCGSDATINIYEIETGKITKTLSGHTGLIRFLLMLDNQDTLLSSSDDSTIRMWSLSGKNQIRVFMGHKLSANFILLLQSNIFLSLSDDSTIRIWNLEKQQQENTLKGHTSWVITADVMKDGTIVSSGADKSIRFWSQI